MVFPCAPVAKTPAEVAAQRSPGSLPKDRRPEIDAAALRRQAKRAKAELLRASAVPVPAADADEALLEEEAAAAAEAEWEAAEAEWLHENAEDYEEEYEDREEEYDEDYGDWEGYCDQGYGQVAQEASDMLCTKSQEAYCGWWTSNKGGCRIFPDHLTSQLSYEEPLEDGRLHGFLVKAEAPEADNAAEHGDALRWEAELMVLDEEQRPWYGPSFGEKPEVVGDIQVTYWPGPRPTLQTRIRIADEDEDWQAPVNFWRKPTEAERGGEMGTDENVFEFGGGGADLGGY